MISTIYRFHTLAEINPSDVAYFSFAVLLVFMGLFSYFCFAWWRSKKKDSLSPYTQTPLRRGEYLKYDTMEKVLRFLYDMHEYDNRIFDLKRSSYCRETGRIFQNSINLFDIIEVDWSFLKKRYQGHFVSWGSLSKDHQQLIRESHHSLQGFQTDLSSPSPAPKDIEKIYAFAKPGPLYVDISNRILLGWKMVPGTELEVLIVQKPKKLKEP